MKQALRSILESDPRILYALLFGSRARGVATAHSDTDVAIEFEPAARPVALEIGDLLSRLEAAAGGRVDLVLLEEAPPALAYRVFRDGVVLFARDSGALSNRKARAIIEYLDFKPIESIFTHRQLQPSRRG